VLCCPRFSGCIAMAKKIVPSKKSKRNAEAPSATKPAKELKSREVVKSEPPTAAAVAAPKSSAAPLKTPATERASASRGNLPAEAALSFLRDTKGAVSWSLREMSQTLNISREEAERVVALLQLQGYVQAEAHKSGEWMTTPAGETVSGAKTPRFDRATVEGAIASLKQRIEETNKDRAARFQITRAVVFGDFLAKDRARVQAADVGVELVRRNDERAADEIAVAHSAVEAREEQAFLRQLRGRSALLNLKTYADWMSKRSHEKLL
jgi:hypothetical protein